MVNWIHFPKNKPLDEVSAQIVKAFEAVDATIDSYTHQLKSDEVLTAVRPGLEALGFDVEKSKKSDDLVAVPVLYGVNGKIEKAFDLIDGIFDNIFYFIKNLLELIFNLAKYIRYNLVCFIQLIPQNIFYSINCITYNCFYCIPCGREHSLNGTHYRRNNRLDSIPHGRDH